VAVRDLELERLARGDLGQMLGLGGVDELVDPRLADLLDEDAGLGDEVALAVRPTLLVRRSCSSRCRLRRAIMLAGSILRLAE
jgi:hypothetical protein